MITELFGKLNPGVNDKKSITLKNNGGILIIDVDETKFVSDVKNQIDHIDFNFYLNDNTQEPKRVLLATKTWNSLEDRAIAFNQVPAATYVEVVVVVDESYILSHNLIPETEFPIKVSISDENILSKAGGSGAIDTEIDAKITEHNTSPTAHEDIRQLVSKAVKYRGSVDNYSDLPTNPNDGDMYNIVNADIEHQINAGDNVVWVADTQIWDNLGGFIDLSQLQVMMDFPSWLTAVASDPTKEMKDVITILDAYVTTTGLIYMGGLSVADLPVNSMVQAETTIEVMKSSNGDPLYKFTLISTNVPPYIWTATGYDGVFDGWQARPTEEDLLDYVKFTDYPITTPDTARAGVVRVDGRGLAMTSSGLLVINLASNDLITARTNTFNPIVSSNLNFAVKAALSDANRISDMTDDEKTNARGVIDSVGFNDIASATKAGVVMINPAVGVKIYADGSLGIQYASETEISSRDTNTTKAIIPITLNFAVKASLTDANHMTMTEDEQSVARSVLGALGSADLTEYVKNTDYATQNKGGVVKVHTGYGLKIGELGTLMINKANQEMIDGKGNETNPIVPSNLDYAVRSVLPAVQTSLPETIIKNCIYDLGEQTTLTITLPTTGSVGDWLQFDFLSGATATTLTITSTAGLSGYDLIPEINTVYSLYLDWGVIGKDSTGAITYGWRFSYSEYPFDV